MTQEEAHGGDVAEELKKKYNLTDEALAEVAEKLSIATPQPERGVEPKGERGGLFEGLGDDEFGRMQKLMGGANDISLSGVILLTEMWERQDRRREERERKRDEEPAWAKRLGERVGVLETKLQVPALNTASPTDATTTKLFDDLKAQMKELKDENKALVEKLEKQASEAKDEAQKQLLESKISEVNGHIAALQSAIDGLKVPPQTPKDVVDQYIEAKSKLTASGILKEERGAAARSREEVRAKGQDMVLKHVDEAATNISKTFEQIKDSVIIPRLRVESGVANTSGLTEKERQDYYNRLKITQ